MASFTIQKSTLNGKSTIQILSPEVKPMVMHYNHDNGEYGPYMLDDYTEELASSHSVRNVIGDEFTLDNLKAKFKEIMSMNVKPSTNTNLLNVKFDWEGNMIDKNYRKCSGRYRIHPLLGISGRHIRRNRRLFRQF